MLETHARDVQGQEALAAKSQAIQELAKLLGVTALPPMLFNTLWVCPLTRVQHFIIVLTHNDEGERKEWFVTRVQKSGRMIQQFRRIWSEEKSQSEVPSEANSEASSPLNALAPIEAQEDSPSPAKRIKLDSVPTESGRTAETNSAKRKAKVRDNDRCVITNELFPEVAHIIPYSVLIGAEDGREHLWDGLDSFYGKDYFIKALEIFGNEEDRRNLSLQGHDCVENMICFDHKVHLYSNNGFIAFKPHPPSPDGKSMILELWFQQKTSQNDEGDIDVTTTPSIDRNQRYGENSAHLMKLVDVEKGECRILVNGDQFTLTTKDPETHPLPRYHLLELAWCLQRMSGMSRGVEYYDDEEEEDEYSESFEAWREESL